MEAVAREEDEDELEEEEASVAVAVAVAADDERVVVELLWMVLTELLEVMELFRRRFSEVVVLIAVLVAEEVGLAVMGELIKVSLLRIL